MIDVDGVPVSVGVIVPVRDDDSLGDVLGVSEGVTSFEPLGDGDAPMLDERDTDEDGDGEAVGVSVPEPVGVGDAVGVCVCDGVLLDEVVDD